MSFLRKAYTFQNFQLKHIFSGEIAYYVWIQYHFEEMLYFNVNTYLLWKHCIEVLGVDKGTSIVEDSATNFSGTRKENYKCIFIIFQQINSHVSTILSNIFLLLYYLILFI